MRPRPCGQSAPILRRDQRRLVLSLLTPYVDEITVGVPFPDLSRRGVMRAMAKRAHEGLAAVLALVNHGHAYSARVLLRPMCEDFIFARFLRLLTEHDAEEYLQCKGAVEIVRGLRAQERFFALAPSKYVHGPPPDHDTLEALLQQIAAEDTRLSAELDVISKGIGLSGKNAKVSDLAMRAGLKDEYDYFYHATSAEVHANPHRLFRLLWGDPTTGVGRIDTRGDEEHDAIFALAYGVWLTSFLIDVVMDELPYEWPKGAKDSYWSWVLTIVQLTIDAKWPCIVTNQELYWPTSASSSAG